MRHEQHLIPANYQKWMCTLMDFLESPELNWSLLLLVVAALHLSLLWKHRGFVASLTGGCCSAHRYKRPISAVKKRLGGECALFVLPLLPQGNGGYLIRVSDLLLGIKLSSHLSGDTSFDTPFIHMLSICFCSRKLREETKGCVSVQW